MIQFGNFLLIKIIDSILAILRLPIFDSPRLSSLYGLKLLQPIMEAVSLRKAFEVYRHARTKCPAYREFLDGHHQLHNIKEFTQLPFTDKVSYIKKFSIEDRCLEGKIPLRGVVIDESSGSSGSPNNWVRGREERASVIRLIQHAYQIRYGEEALIVINCFALGAWATGMNVSMALVDLAILKSVGPDKSKLEATLQTFGPKYRYSLAGYPPFFKDWLSSTSLDLSQFEIHLIVGGEGLSEGLRDFFLKSCKTVYSSYGASDLEINIGAETEFTIALRKLCVERPELSQQLFGRDDVPMIFQYNPVNYFIERTSGGELLVTVLRLQNAAPRVRYNIRDIGGSLSFRKAAKVLSKSEIDIDSLSEELVALPLLFVYGRNDLSIAFYGSKVFSTDLDQIINADEDFQNTFFSFQLSVREKSSLEKILIIDLEMVKTPVKQFLDDDLSGLLFKRLQDVNQDFREVSKLFGPEKLLVRQHQHGSGPFKGRDIRLKNQYVV